MRMSVRKTSVVARSGRKLLSRSILLCLLLTLGACATIPEALDHGGPLTATTPLEALKGGHEGEIVRWGGVIIGTTPLADQTCFEVMGQSLDGSAAPYNDDNSLGRFIACIGGFYEPTLYTSGRAVTFVGRIDGMETQKVGEFPYSFPRLDADAVYLWPKRPNVIYVPFYEPYWDPFWPYYHRPYPYRR